MVPVAVVVDVVPPEFPAEQAQVLVDACSSSVGTGSCALSVATPESTRPGAVALVVWQSPGFLVATVRVGRRNGEWTSRRLSFSEHDPPRERSVTVGLTVAELLDETHTEPAVDPTVEAEPPPSSVTPVSVAQPAIPPPGGSRTPAPRQTPPWLRFGVGSGLLVGNGWDHGAPMLGGWATLMLSGFHDRVLALAGASYATSSGPSLPEVGEQRSNWLGLELGCGVQTRVAPFRLFAAPELAFQSVRARPERGGTLSGQEVQLKLRGGAIWEASRHWRVSLGAALRVLPIDAPSGDPNRVRRSGISGELQAGIELWP